MNKIKIFLPVFLLVVVGMFALSSCEKEEELNTSNDDQVLTRILDFKQKVENPNLQKNGEELSIEDAVWLIEASLNYTYSVFNEGDSLLNNFSNENFIFEVNSSNGFVNFNQVATTYLEFLAKIDAIIDDFDNNSQKVVLSDISYNNSAFELNVVIGQIIISTKSIFPNFGTTDYWYWGEDLGKAPPYSGYLGHDAASKISDYANMRIAMPAGPSYLTDIETLYEEEMSSFTWSGASNGSTEPHLTPTEMNYWLNKAIEAGILRKPEGKSLINYNIVESYGLGGDDRFHFLNLKYGIWHKKSNYGGDL